jgi:hypothetical protein
MKLSRLIALLICEAPLDRGAVVKFLIFGYVGATLIGIPLMIGDAGGLYFLRIHPNTEVILLLIPLMVINPLFLDGNYGIQGWTSQPVNSLEFFFSRAINRSSIFFVKTSLYLCLILTPLLAISAYSCTAPVIRIEFPANPLLPANVLADREASKQFYLTHFDGAYLQTFNTGKHGECVVLPTGRVNQAVLSLFWIFLVTLLLQVIAFSFPPGMRWGSLPVFCALLFFISWGDSSRKPPSCYEMGLAFVAQHTFLALLVLGILTALSQRYCCRRFVATEITS